MENVGIFYGPMGFIIAIWCILWPVGKSGVVWYILPLFWYIVSRKIWHP
jgi:hypothetical protein